MQLLKNVLTVFLPTLVFAGFLLPLFANRMKCRKSGFRIEVMPINSHNSFYMVLGGFILPLLSRWTPRAIWRRLRYTLHGWQLFDQKRDISSHSSFIMVGPEHNELWIEDPEIVEQVLRRTHDFTQAPITKKLIGIFGPNVMTLDGNDWQRHRRIVTAALGERLSPLVWQESSRQAEAMVESFSTLPNGESNQTLLGLRRIALNVLSFSGYGIAEDWRTNIEHDKRQKVSHADILDSLTTGFILIAVAPLRLIEAKFMPKSVRNIGLAAREFSSYTKELLDRERSIFLDCDEQEKRKSYINSLVKLSYEQGLGNAKNSQELSNEELRGNLFQFTLAGFDTTANTLAYAFAALAVYPDIQDWIVEEIDRVLPPGSEAVYEAVFPQLVRCMALMYETLRLYTPVGSPGRVAAGDQRIATSSASYIVPDKTHVLINFAGIHTRKEFWGSDASAFRPARWIANPNMTFPKALITPQHGTFIPWSSGGRVCPGMKMAQVEFLAVVSTVFRKYTLKPAQIEGETIDMARERTYAVMRDSQPRVTLQMNRPTDVKLRWTSRNLGTAK